MNENNNEKKQLTPAAADDIILFAVGNWHAASMAGWQMYTSLVEAVKAYRETRWGTATPAMRIMATASAQMRGYDGQTYLDFLDQDEIGQLILHAIQVGGNLEDGLRDIEGAMRAGDELPSEALGRDPEGW